MDIGNARIKLGLFDREHGAAMPEPLATLSLMGDAPNDATNPDEIASWLEEIDPLHACKHAPYDWSIASVNRPAAARLIDWLREHRPADRVRLLCNADVPLEVRLPQPELVGIDRLVNAVAVNRLRQPDAAAIVVDVGTAITVDLLSADAAFLGGAILPGMAMSARALNEFTDRLPVVDVSKLTAPPAVGAATVSAIESGVFWAAVGAIRELVRQMSDGQNLVEVFITGGAGAAVMRELGPNVRYVPHLTLSGIALAAARVARSED
ncbi:MAG: type III pantothenate kinase [Thermoguttaceae bacterium]